MTQYCDDCGEPIRDPDPGQDTHDSCGSLTVSTGEEHATTVVDTDE